MNYETFNGDIDKEENFFKLTLNGSLLGSRKKHLDQKKQIHKLTMPFKIIAKNMKNLTT